MYFTPAIAVAILAATACARDPPTENTFGVLRFNEKALLEGRVDPMVSPGVAASHAHTIQGGNAFAMTMDEKTLFKSNCTTAKINNDMSAYWFPGLYFRDPVTGELEYVPVMYQSIYYFFEHKDAAKYNQPVTAFPPGLNIFVGKPNSRRPPLSGGRSIIDHADGEIQPVQWTCPRLDDSTPLYPPNSDGLSGVGIQDPRNPSAGVGFPDVDCTGTFSPMRGDIHFPSCYDPSKGLTNYKENMHYPKNGKCPDGTIRTAHIFAETYFETMKFAGRWTPNNGTSPWVLSNGDDTGYSNHADFISGWDVETLQTVIDTCNAGSRGMDLCDVPGGVSNSGGCQIENPVPEQITGKLSALPGNNKIGPWGVDVVPGSAAKPPVAAPAVKQAVKAPEEQAAPSSSKEAKAAPKPTPAPKKEESKAHTSVVEEVETVWVTVTVHAPGPAQTPPSKSSVANVASGWSYKGCFSDSLTDRVLSGIKFAQIGNKQVTSTKCVEHCSAQGFRLAGTEFGGECFCGNELKNSGAIGEDKCNMTCEGDSAQKCGGSLALSVFEGTPARSIRRSAHMHRHIGLGHSH